ncbi:YL1 nuclear protein [Colletotrichum graminicola]|uniref:YL1 nuclear protein n=1 Tax=Colletotrichum graminicola (strain M1.001 / M2 / FGSC 10212) TaxID=645133 RepID=E3Q8B2_COLGM|nr:YL1 nuclear protein [Colletotrichum graminicola M1.001]EFQ27124.1 YL1 nuclear protein [Colletotrichum graminicola M1.001]WDK16278.1 YL1 nuclear protein [Colletotrichum graminicola]
MATTTNEPTSSSRDESSDSGSGSDSENDTPTISTPTTVEWLVTGRSKRSTAGNRMKSMLANEEPDSDLELLFAEDDNDEGFTDVDDAGSDVQMDSSSDDEDEQNRGDDLEGEKELEKQARDKKLASRKRKAQDAIPAKFRKKVRIDQAAAPAPRPKKKSERTSWLPSPGDMPIRASLRQTTMLSKEQLHQQMKEREAKRLKQLAVMEKKAKKLEAMKKPPMTQAERLAEAALVEKRNAKSLNRWEVAEKAREEERLAKLAALNNRTLKGPVITYWSGIGKWENHLKHVGKVAEEEKAPRKKREKKDKGDKAKGKDKDEEGSKKEEGTATGAASASLLPSTTPDGLAEAKPGAPSASPAPADAENKQPSGAPKHSSQPAAEPRKATLAVKEEDQPRVMAPPPIPPLPPVSPALPRPEDKPRLMAPPSIPPPPSLSSSLMAPPPMPPPPKTSPPVLAAPVLAPPVLAPPLGGIHLVQHTTQPKSNVLAPPNTTQHKSPLSMPAPPPPSARPPAHPLAPPHPSHQPTPTQPAQPPAPPKPTLPTVASTPPAATPAPAVPPAPEEPPPSEVARNAFILRSFDEELIRDKTVQTQILFGRRMDRLAKPAPRPVCVITAHTARYRDPETGLPYFNAYAYREIQRLRRGEYKWSSLLGAWVGSCTYAARGVPERFLKGGKPKEPRTKEKENGNATVAEGTESQKTKADKTTPPAQAAVGEKPPTKTADATVPLPPPSAPQTQTQTQQLPQPPAEAQNQDQGAKPAAAKPASQPGAASVPPAV